MFEFVYVKFKCKVVEYEKDRWKRLVEECVCICFLGLNVLKLRCSLGSKIELDKLFEI